MNNNMNIENDKLINKKKVKAKKRVLEFLDKHRYNEEENHSQEAISSTASSYSKWL